MLALASLLTVYSTVGVKEFNLNMGSTEFYVVKQLFFIGLGICVAYFFYNVHYLHLARFAKILLIVAIIAQGYTTFWGVEINNARRWMEIPLIAQRFQTSDFARVALIIYVACQLAINQDKVKEWKQIFVPIIVPILLVCGLMMPADFSTSALLFLTMFVMLFVGRISIRFLMSTILIGLILFGVIFIIGSFFPDVVRVDTWVSRITDFLTNPEDNWQLTQSKIAIANGEWFGTGPGYSMQKFHLPYAYADFIYAILCEEYGLFGGLVIIILYLLLLYRSFKMILQCPKAFGALLAMGLTLNIVIQAFANIAVAVRLLPATGLTLPMISMGGTSLLITSMSFGIILSVSRYVEQSQEQHIALEKIENESDEGSN